MLNNAQKDSRQPIRLFPEEPGVYTEGQASVWFNLLRILHAEGCEADFLRQVTQKTNAFWLSQSLWDTMLPFLDVEALGIDLLNRSLKPRPMTSADTLFLCLDAQELLAVYRNLESSGYLPQFMESLAAADHPVWVTSDVTNRAREFLLNTKLYLVDRSVRSVMITQTCQCRGKS